MKFIITLCLFFGLSHEARAQWCFEVLNSAEGESMHPWQMSAKGFAELAISPSNQLTSDYVARLRRALSQYSNSFGQTYMARNKRATRVILAEAKGDRTGKWTSMDFYGQAELFKYRYQQLDPRASLFLDFEPLYRLINHLSRRAIDVFNELEEEGVTFLRARIIYIEPVVSSHPIQDDMTEYSSPAYAQIVTPLFGDGLSFYPVRDVDKTKGSGPSSPAPGLSDGKNNFAVGQKATLTTCSGRTQYLQETWFGAVGPGACTTEVYRVTANHPRAYLLIELRKPKTLD